MSIKIKIVVAIIIYIITSYYLGSTYVLPAYNQGREYSNILKDKKNELSYLLFLNKQLPKIELEEIKVNARIIELEEVLKPFINEEELFLEMYNSAKNGGVKLSSISLGEIGTAGENSRVNVSINISGSYSDLLTFLKEIEVFPYVISVERINVSGREGALSASMDLAVYFRGISK